MEAAPPSRRDPHIGLARVMPGLVTVLLAGGRSVELSLSAVGLAHLRNLARNCRVGMGSAPLRAGAGERLGDGFRCS